MAVRLTIVEANRPPGYPQVIHFANRPVLLKGVHLGAEPSTGGAVSRHLMQRLILIRHATAIKNIQDRHGGGGAPLVAPKRTTAPQPDLLLPPVALYHTLNFASVHPH